MNETLQKALAEILTKATEAVSAGVSFLSDQLPDVVHQLLVWKAAQYGSTALVCAILLGLWFYLGLKIAKKVNENVPKYDRGFPYFIFGMVSIIPSCVLFPGFWMNFQNLLQVVLAPKIYLIEYAASLVK